MRGESTRVSTSRQTKTSTIRLRRSGYNRAGRVGGADAFAVMRDGMAGRKGSQVALYGREYLVAVTRRRRAGITRHTPPRSAAREIEDLEFARRKARRG